MPQVGDVLHIGPAASVQFRHPIYFRVIRVLDWPTYTGWVWLDGYQLNDAGEAVEQRSIFVQMSGVRRLGGASTRPRRRPTARDSDTVRGRDPGDPLST